MARLARAVFSWASRHVTQRGNGRAQTFFCDDDALHRDLLAELRNNRSNVGNLHSRFAGKV